MRHLQAIGQFWVPLGVVASRRAKTSVMRIGVSAQPEACLQGDSRVPRASRTRPERRLRIRTPFPMVRETRVFAPDELFRFGIEEEYFLSDSEAGRTSTPALSRRARMRKPSCLISCIQPRPETGPSLAMAQGSIIPSPGEYAHATTCARFRKQKRKSREVKEPRIAPGPSNLSSRKNVIVFASAALAAGQFSVFCDGCPLPTFTCVCAWSSDDARCEFLPTYPSRD
jgi:hypothetical protein